MATKDIHGYQLGSIEEAATLLRPDFLDSIRVKYATDAEALDWLNRAQIPGHPDRLLDELLSPSNVRSRDYQGELMDGMSGLDFVRTRTDLPPIHPTHR